MWAGGVEGGQDLNLVLSDSEVPALRLLKALDCAIYTEIQQCAHPLLLFLLFVDPHHYHGTSIRMISRSRITSFT